MVSITLMNVAKFADLYQQAMDAKSPTLSTYTVFQRLGHKSNGMLSRILKGDPETAVPMEELDTWLDAVEVTGEERAALERQAIYEFGPAPMKRLLALLDQYQGQIQVYQRVLAQHGLTPADYETE